MAVYILEKIQNMKDILTCLSFKVYPNAQIVIWTYVFTY
jgi:hypothetical protein